MPKIRNARRVFLVLSVVLAIGTFAGVLWGTASSGTKSQLLGRATYQPNKGEVLQVQRVLPGEWGAVVQARPALDIAVQSINFDPHSSSGWHSHPGPVFISVVTGQITFYEGDDPNCTPIVRHAGEGYLDTGDHPHIARNETDQPALNIVTYLAPPGADLRINEPAPGNCPF